MANIKSAKKRILVTEKRTAKNKSVRSKVKTAVKKVDAAIAANDKAAAEAFVDYMFDIETQKLFVQQGYVPMISEAAEGTEVPTIDDIKVLPMDVNYMRENSSSMLEKFTSIFGAQ